MKSIEQEVTFDAKPELVFEALMDSKQHAAFTGAPARVSREVGGPVSCHDGMITAINVELEKNTRIVQAWRVKPWPEGVYSIATFALEPAGAKTKLTFTQHGVPDAAHEMITKGWEERYWKPLRAYLAKA
jgi:activator of HSP90 ATPase